MEYYYITFRSLTAAQRGERRLKQLGYRCRLGRTPRALEERGCGYGIGVWARSPEQLTGLLRRENIPMGRLYLQRPGEAMEELTV